MIGSFRCNEMMMAPSVTDFADFDSKEMIHNFLLYYIVLLYSYFFGTLAIPSHHHCFRSIVRKSWNLPKAELLISVKLGAGRLNEIIFFVN